MAYATINDPSAQFQAQLYTGNATTSTNITNTGNANLQPDFVWIKNRTGGADWHDLTDTNRGATKSLFSNTNSAEGTAAQSLQAFLTDGFTIGSDAQVNRNANNYVAWQWKANGGTTASNSNGSITSTVQANTTAGFSIVTYTGNNTSGATVGHGLGVAPDTIILKARGIADQNWFVNTPVGGGVGYMMLNQTNADSGSNSSVWNSTTPTATVFTLGNSGGVNDSTTYVAYCFKSIKGYSKMGNYSGNGNSNGPFVYTGFSPAWVMIKNTAGSTNWNMYDNKRSTFNKADDILMANASDAESAVSGKSIDFLSNGFKLRGSDNETNNYGNVHFYMAFAQNPLVATNDVIALAR